MANDLQLFNFRGKELRVFKIGEELWFIGIDIAKYLEYADPKQAIRQHCKKAVTANDLFKGVYLTPFDLHPQTKLIPESDFYRLVLKCTLPIAEELESFVTEEVLPTIRKTGSYSLETTQPHQIPQTLSEALRLAADLEEEKQQALAAKKQLEEENKQIKPQAEKWAAFMNSEGNFTFESAAKIVKTGQNRLFALLREKKYLFRNKENHNYNTPYQTKVDAGYFVVKLTTITKSNKQVAYPQVFITPKGLEHIIKNHFNPLEVAV